MAGSDDVLITVAASETELIVRYRPAGPIENAVNLYVPLGTHRHIGAAVLPFAHGCECSTVLLPFKCDLLLSAEIRPAGVKCFKRVWKRWRWSERVETQEFQGTIGDGEFLFRIPRALLGPASKIDFIIYAKDPSASDGWGWLWGLYGSHG